MKEREMEGERQVRKWGENKGMGKGEGNGGKEKRGERGGSGMEEKGMKGAEGRKEEELEKGFVKGNRGRGSR